MVRTCSVCGKLGHNSRTCINGRGIRLFGVWLGISSSAIAMQKRFIVDSMNSSSSPSSSSLSSSRISGDQSSHAICLRHLSDALAHAGLQDSTKGRQWTEEEHRAFLKGMEKLGKGDWRGISKSYVKSRTSTQVASHAQKYFLRKKGTTTFDLVERKNKAAQPKREDLDPTVLSLGVPRLFRTFAAEKTISPNYGQHLDLTLNTIPNTLEYRGCESTSVVDGTIITTKV